MSQGQGGGQGGAGVMWALDNETLTSLYSFCFHHRHHHQSTWNLGVGGTFEDHGRHPGFECEKWEQPWQMGHLCPAGVDKIHHL